MLMKLVANVLHMARNVKISDNYSVKHNPNFLIFLLSFFSRSQIKNLVDFANMSELSINQLYIHELYTLLQAVVYP